MGNIIEMKHLIICCLLGSTFLAHSQTCFTYDNAGNRKDRNVCIVKLPQPELNNVKELVLRNVSKDLKESSEIDLSNLIIYPNPAFSSFALIKQELWVGSTLTILNQEGKLIKKFIIGNDDFDVSNLGAGIGNFNGVSGGALKNIWSELGFGIAKGAVTGGFGGAFGAAIDGRDMGEGFIQGAKYGAIAGGTLASMNILAFGAAYVPEKEYGDFGRSKPVYRRGYFLWPKRTGISIGRNLVTRLMGDSKFDNHLRAHEAGHYFKQSKLGFAKFYARTLGEYAKHRMRHTYDTVGTLEFGAQIYSLNKVGYFWSHRYRMYINHSNYNKYYLGDSQTMY